MVRNLALNWVDEELLAKTVACSLLVVVVLLMVIPYSVQLPNMFCIWLALRPVGESQSLCLQSSEGTPNLPAHPFTLSRTNVAFVVSLLSLSSSNQRVSNLFFILLAFFRVRRVACDLLEADKFPLRLPHTQLPSLQGLPAFFIEFLTPGVWFLANDGSPWYTVFRDLGYVHSKRVQMVSFVKDVPYDPFEAELM